MKKHADTVFAVFISVYSVCPNSSNNNGSPVPITFFFFLRPLSSVRVPASRVQLLLLFLTRINILTVEKYF